jgi:anti-sigma factor RsiW
MNIEANDEKELLRLCGLMVDGQLDETDWRGLSKLLSASASARAFYRSYMDAHARLLLHYEPVPVADEPYEELVEPLASQLEPSASQTSWFNIAAALAVAVLVWMNLSLSASTATDFRAEFAASATEIERSASQIRELLHAGSESPPQTFTQGSRTGLDRTEE